MDEQEQHPATGSPPVEPQRSAGAWQSGVAVRPIAPPPAEAWQRPVRIEPVPDTPYGLAILGAPQATSQAALGALVAGVAAALVALVVACVGLAGAGVGWGLWIAGAFTMLTGFLSAAAVGLGLIALRQMRRRPVAAHPHAHPPAAPSAGGAWPVYGPTAQWQPHGSAGAPWQPQGPGGASWQSGEPRQAGAVTALSGRGLALAGVVCGVSALVLTACSLAVVAAIQLG